MWTVETEDGKVITEKDCYWPALPADVRISKLSYRDRTGREGNLHGFDAYGFQRFSLTPPGGQTIAHAGTQLIGVSGEEVMIIEIDEATGSRSEERIPLSELTYNRDLLRHGVAEG